MEPTSWRQLVSGLVLGAVNGALGGLALLALLPASVALGTGRPSWGLGLSGWLVVLAVLALGAAASDFVGQRLGMLGADGRVAQRGSHDELVGVEGPYRDFWEYRSRARGWQLV